MRLYRDLLEAVGCWRLCRIWNYVPQINQPGPLGLENYRAFCWGRSVAFEQHFGGELRTHLPASSAVGTAGGHLEVVFVAADAAVEHFENPLQVPAYQYPAEHGPRAPCFARATTVRHGARSSVFIAGTAAIRGHHTVAPRDTQAQVAVTLENLRLIARRAGLPDGLESAGDARRHWRVYLRHPGDLPVVQAALAPLVAGRGDTVDYLHADICRAELTVEIEVSVLGV